MSVIKKCTLSDLPVLQELSIQTFREAFAATNTEANITAYLETAFQLEKLQKELACPASAFYLIYEAEQPAGYLKLNEQAAQTDLQDASSLEVERIYVLDQFQGKGLGRRLMDAAIEAGRRQQKTYLWLGAWEKNTKALAFYERLGFYTIGTHPFIVGEEVQTDYLMRKDL